MPYLYEVVGHVDHPVNTLRILSTSRLQTPSRCILLEYGVCVFFVTTALSRLNKVKQLSRAGCFWHCVVKDTSSKCEKVLSISKACITTGKLV